MKPQRAFALLTAATVLAACGAAWLTPQQEVAQPSAPNDGISAPVVFSVR